jgi:hypothetical protein
MSKIGLYSVSPLQSNCLLEKSKLFFKNIDFHITYNNTKVGLSEFYNNVIENNTEYDTLILCHHDVSLLYTNLEYQVKEGLKHYDIIGIAGCRDPRVVEKNLWHWMSERTSQRGFAAHPITPPDSPATYITAFGPSPDRVAIIDGVFMAIDAKKIKQSKARFDSNFMWHHYDIDFSLTCNKNEIKLGVWPILINHQSPGLLNIHDQEWNRSNNYFIKKWTV